MTVTKIDHRVVDRLAHELSPVLDASGIVMANVIEVDNVDRWRKAARRAGRLLGYPGTDCALHRWSNGLGRARTTRPAG
jgi:hypothetical protein